MSIDADMPHSVAEVYDAYSPGIWDALCRLRKLILETAAETEGIGTIEESLKWGQHSFATVRPKTGSPVRIDALKDGSNRYALYFVCHTHLVDRFLEIYPQTFKFEGDRALIFKVGEPLPETELKHCIAMALTYHLKH